VFSVAGVVAIFVMFIVVLVMAVVVVSVAVLVVTGVVAGFVAVVVAVVVAGFVAFVVAFVVAGIMAGVAVLPPAPFLLACWLVGASLSAWQWRWTGIVIAGAMVALGVQHLGWALLAVPATLAGYYRLLPTYPVWAVLSFIAQRTEFLGKNRVSLLRRLPPHTDELLWLPPPGHDRLLAEAFRAKPAVALDTLQQMQVSPRPGFRRTARLALPQIVADQVAAVKTIPELIATASSAHPFLPFLAPDLYVSSEALPLGSLPSGGGRRVEILALLPRFQAIARDVERALQAGHPGLCERGLERVLLDKLLRLPRELPGLGVDARAIERWRPVWERWQAVVQAEIERLRTKMGGDLIRINPFVFGDPLPLKAHQFKGRTGFADQILRLSLDRNRLMLVLHGPRRCGKSSFLRNLPRLLPGRILPVYIDLQQQATTESEAYFWYNLVRTMRQDCCAQGVELPEARRSDFEAKPYAALQDWLDQALPPLGERRILLNMDEFEEVGNALATGQLSERLPKQLRHMIQHCDPLCFLFSGVQTLEELGPNWSSYFISAVPIEMLYLEPREAEAVLTDPYPGFELRYAEGLVAEIIALTRGQPYLLQLIGSELVKHANLNRTQVADAALLEAAIQSGFTSGQIYFTNLWTESTGVSPAQVAAGQRLLLAVAQGQPVSAGDDPAAPAALKRLLRLHVLEHAGEGYRFEVPLVGRWVRERAMGI
jgi:hypothetical protein